MTEGKNGIAAEAARSEARGAANSAQNPKSLRSWGPSRRRVEPEAIALNRILGDFRFPASKEEVTRKLATEAFARDGGRAVELHDLVVQLEPQEFADLEALRKALREYHAWEKTQDTII